MGDCSGAGAGMVDLGAGRRAPRRFGRAGERFRSDGALPDGVAPGDRAREGGRGSGAVRGASAPGAVCGGDDRVGSAAVTVPAGALERPAGWPGRAMPAAW